MKTITIQNGTFMEKIQQIKKLTGVCFFDPEGAASRLKRSITHSFDPVIGSLL